MSVTIQETTVLCGGETARMQLVKYQIVLTFDVRAAESNHDVNEQAVFGNLAFGP